MKTTAWKGDAKLKAMYIGRLEEHRRLEHLKQGVGFESDDGVRGCNIGCLFEKYDHAAGEKESGIPEVLLRLADTIFEGLPAEEANDFALAWPRAIEPGADLSRVRWQFCAFLMRENIERVLTLKIADDIKERVVTAIRGVLALHEQAAESGRPAEAAAKSAVAEAKSAAEAAWSESAEAAARSESAAARSAIAAAWSAEAEAEAAARSAAAAAAWSAAAAAWSAEAKSAIAAAAAAAWSESAAAWSAAEAAWSAEEAAWSESAAARSAAYRRYAKEFVRLCGSAARKEVT